MNARAARHAFLFLTIPVALGFAACGGSGGPSDTPGGSPQGGCGVQSCGSGLVLDPTSCACVPGQGATRASSGSSGPATSPRQSSAHPAPSASAAACSPSTPCLNGSHWDSTLCSCVIFESGDAGAPAAEDASFDDGGCFQRITCFPGYEVDPDTCTCFPTPDATTVDAGALPPLPDGSVDAGELPPLPDALPFLDSAPLSYLDAAPLSYLEAGPPSYPEASLPEASFIEAGSVQVADAAPLTFIEAGGLPFLEAGSVPVPEAGALAYADASPLRARDAGADASQFPEIFGAEAGPGAGSGPVGP